MTVHWPVERLPDAVHRLAERAGLVQRGKTGGPSLPTACRALGIELHPSDLAVDRLETELWRAAPAILRSGDVAIAVVGGSARAVTVITVDGGTRAVDPGSLVARGRAEERAPTPAAARLLALAGAPTTGDTVRVWTLRPSAGGSAARHLLAARVPRRALELGALHVVRLVLLAASWWILGRGAMEGTLDGALLWGWALVLATLVTVSAGVDWLQGHLLLDVHRWYRRKTLHGATRVAPRVSRSLGSGQLLGRVFEAEALDTLAFNAGLGGVTAAVDAGFCAALFLAIPGGGLLAAVFGAWLAAVAAAGVWLYRLQRGWTLERIAMSEDVVEGLLGRRTRLAQLGARRAHDREDPALERYVAASAEVDRAETSFQAVAGRGWLVVGLVALGVLGWSGPLSPGATAAAIGGVLLAFRALTRVATQVHLAAALVVCWRQASVLYRASSAPEVPGVPELVETSGGRTGVVLQARRLGHRLDRGATIEEASLSIAAGDRILLSGPSGGGKSTLARLLSGLEEPTAGTVTLGGFDRRSLGEQEWARRVAYVPPFCDNHVFSNSFLYNLLPGSWPPEPSQVDEALQVCRELGLQPLLERMPGHLQQTVGETGWRLSHGERSRLFLARAILQRPELVILDESFGALDAGTLQECMECVLRRAPTLILISHA